MFSSYRSINARLGFEQSLIHFEYFWHVYTIFSHYCSNFPSFRTRTRKEKVNHSIIFFTRSMPCLTEIKNIFYKDNKKIIPLDIYDYLTPRALAH